MPGEKRKKGGSSEGSDEERKAINWANQYLELRKEKDAELSELRTKKDAELSELRKEKDAELSELRKEKDAKLSELRKELSTIMMENRDLAVSNKELTMKLELANNELLSAKSMLIERRVVEYFEKKSSSKMPANLRTGSHQRKWEWIFNNDSDFHKKIRTHIGRSKNAKDIGNLAAEVFSNASVEDHYFNKQGGVEINKNDYTSDQRRFFRALCATIPCTLNEI